MLLCLDDPALDSLQREGLTPAKRTQLHPPPKKHPQRKCVTDARVGTFLGALPDTTVTCLATNPCTNQKHCLASRNSGLLNATWGVIPLQENPIMVTVNLGHPLQPTRVESSKYSTQKPNNSHHVYLTPSTSRRFCFFGRYSES